LPDTAFKENARTEVVTDIIFLRKRGEAEQETAEKALGIRKLTEEEKKDSSIDRSRDEMGRWLHSSAIDDPGGSGEKINANGCFLEHPEMVIGKIDASGTMNRRAELNVKLETRRSSRTA
jgi:hypothetical protein